MPFARSIDADVTVSGQQGQTRFLQILTTIGGTFSSVESISGITVQKLTLVLTFVLGSIALDALANPKAPAGLLVNGVTSPLAIERDAVRFTWKSEDTSRGASQTAYQIVLAPGRKGLSGEGTQWWDSGKVVSAKSASVDYTGSALPAAKRFWWKVRVWDETGKPGPYSAPASFDTGLAQNEWTAHYVWDGTTNQNNFAYFRKTFSVTNKPALAKVYVTAHNDYLLYFNGQLLGRGPARCDPYHNGQYNSYDITKLLKTGSNVFAAIGHWQGTWNNSGVNAKPAFLLEARLDYPDGSSTRIGTDAPGKFCLTPLSPKPTRPIFLPCARL